jgi:hypothetical protein
MDRSRFAGQQSFYGCRVTGCGKFGTRQVPQELKRLRKKSLLRIESGPQRLKP